MAKRGLGRGLEALIPVAAGMEKAGGVVSLAVEDIRPSRYQPRRRVGQEALEELARSIQEHGVVQPIVVRRMGDGQYELVAGERRWRACQVAGLTEVPALVKELTDREAMEMAMVENLQREDLTALEEARAYRALVEEFGLTQEEVAVRVGKSRPYVANMLRLLHLPEVVQSYLEQGLLSAGHARALLSLEQRAEQEEVARAIVAEGWSVRETEQAVRRRQRGTTVSTSSRAPVRDQGSWEFEHIEERLSEILGTRVTLRPRRTGGVLEISYYSAEDLDRLIEMMELAVSRET